MNPPADSPARDAALEAIARHGALGAAHLEIEALREQLARAGDFQDAINSFVKAIEADVVHIRERNAALARLEAVRALHHRGTWVDSRHWCKHCGHKCPCPTITALDADGSDASGSPEPPVVSADSDTSRHPRDPEPHTVNESTTAHPTRMENPR